MRTRFGAALLILSCSLACGEALFEEVAVEVEVAGVRADAARNLVLILEDREKRRRLPIWIGIAEAQSIAAQIEEIELPRPNSHDLAKQILDGLEAELERVVVTELRGNTYFAVLVLRKGRTRVEIDSRPSDAIAIALRARVPIFVREAIFETASRESLLEDDVERLPL